MVLIYRCLMICILQVQFRGIREPAIALSTSPFLITVQELDATSSMLSAEASQHQNSCMSCAGTARAIRDISKFWLQTPVRQIGVLLRLPVLGLTSNGQFLVNKKITCAHLGSCFEYSQIKTRLVKMRTHHKESPGLKQTHACNPTGSFGGLVVGYSQIKIRLD